MGIYMQIVIILNFIVNFLLLIASARFFGTDASLLRVTIASLVNCVYVVLSFRITVLSNGFYRTASFIITAVIAYGFCNAVVICIAGYLCLSALTAFITAGLWQNHAASVLFAMVSFCVVVYFWARNGCHHALYIPVEISYHGKRMKLTALRDTGNLLIDPLSGSSVMIVCCDVARELLGLTKHHLADPAGTLEQLRLPGMRLIPYGTIGDRNGMLLAMRIEDVFVSGKKGSRLVAFAPVNFSDDGSYQVLTGGNVC